MPHVFYESGEKWCRWDNSGGCRYRCFPEGRNPEKPAMLLRAWSGRALPPVPCRLAGKTQARREARQQRMPPEGATVTQKETAEGDSLCRCIFSPHGKIPGQPPAAAVRIRGRSVRA